LFEVLLFLPVVSLRSPHYLTTPIISLTRKANTFGQTTAGTTIKVLFVALMRPITPDYPASFRNEFPLSRLYRNYAVISNAGGGGYIADFLTALWTFNH
jgi:hypothetical protein